MNLDWHAFLIDFMMASIYIRVLVALNILLAFF